MTVLALFVFAVGLPPAETAADGPSTVPLTLSNHLEGATIIDPAVDRSGTDDPDRQIAVFGKTWYIYDQGQTATNGWWGQTVNSPYWEPMGLSSPSGGCSWDHLWRSNYTNLAYYAATDTCTSGPFSMNYSYGARLWLRNSVSNTSSPVTVELRKGNRYTETEGALIALDTDTITSTTTSEYSFGFGTHNVSLSSQSLVLKIIYSGTEGNGRIYWDDTSCPSKLTAGLSLSLVCNPDWLTEGEPICYDNYEDTYNGGCNSAPYVFQPFPVQPVGTCNTVFTACGQSGTYLYQGSNYRDTDWFEIFTPTPANIQFSCVGDFPLQIAILDGNPTPGPDPCSDGDLVIDVIYVPSGDVATLSASTGAGTYWLWVGPSQFDGVPCGSEYVMAVQVISDISTSVEEQEPVLPSRLRISSNAPNPFNPTTEITYSIPGDAESSPITLRVYDTAGRSVCTLVDAYQSAGTYTVRWDGTDSGGADVASGVYFYRLSWNGESETSRMVLIR
ncbi:MAG: FlgD immunoglobulin-like domain containing protein [Candidatus Eisenbacteria bacterium]